MEGLFIAIYRYFHQRKRSFWVLLVLVTILMAFGASRIKLEEDITKIFPGDSRAEKITEILQHSKMAERLVMMVSVKDSSSSPNPEDLLAVATKLIDSLHTLHPYIKSISATVDDSKFLQVLEGIQDHLPVFLEEEDYAVLDSLTQPETVQLTLGAHYRQLISPSGVAVKKVITRDPLGFSFLALRKLQRLQYDENFELYENYIVTTDHRHLIFFVQPAFSSGDTGHNILFIDRLSEIAGKINADHQDVVVSYFGGVAVAAENARQIRHDTILTLSIMIALLMVTLLGFFRKKRVPFLILIPVFFGCLFSLCLIVLIKGTLSILALAVGVVILGIAVNYSLHYLVHLKHDKNNEKVIRGLSKPLTIGSATTILAFLALQFTNAPVLRDVGLFSALSLMGAALSALVVLPHFVNDDLFSEQREGRLERLIHHRFQSGRYIVYVILFLTPVLFYFAHDVSFHSDMRKLNFMTKEMTVAQKRLEAINQSSLGSTYVIAEGKTFQEALRKSEVIFPTLQQLNDTDVVSKVASVSTFMISDSLQRERINRWNVFWKSERSKSLKYLVHTEGEKLKFSKTLLNQIDSILDKKYIPYGDAVLNQFRQTFFDDYIISHRDQTSLISLVNVSPENKNKVTEALVHTPVHTFDRQQITNLFVDYVNADFNFIVTVTAGIVFLALLLVYGRIELTLITFMPMMFTWIWILGIMALVGIEFNIVNVMVSTFIFGLGDDYSIFTMDGLQQKYKAGKNNLETVRTSVFLSAVTTICGLGVLIFAEHPALRSIAAISIIGIVSVYVMAQTLEPFLFRLIISGRTEKGMAPMTLRGMFHTVLAYSFFVTGAVLLTVEGLLLRLIPFGKARVRLFYHWSISTFVRTLVLLTRTLTGKIINQTPETFSRPSVIISNHSSILDILFTIQLHPKLILLTSKWVWNSPVFGSVVRLADYYPVIEGVEDSVERLRERTNEGYSILVFPEGTRSADEKIGRFHKGAFYIAEKLNLPVRPLLIHAAGRGVRKNGFYVNTGNLNLKFLSPVEPDDEKYGIGYAERTKKISRYFKEEHARFKKDKETPAYFYPFLVTNYLYKGPVLEWYLRIKLRLEENYDAFNRLVPQKATILDLGCGYGFLSYMLQFLSSERIITGVDYDEEKIDIAQNGYLKSDRLNFICADVASFTLQTYDVIILSDVLHYLSSAQQNDLLKRCFRALQPGGRLIVRDGDADLKQRHKGTKLTEFFSVKVMGFNKSNQELNFISGKFLESLATGEGLKVTRQDDTKFTSNVIFVIDKPV